MPRNALDTTVDAVAVHSVQSRQDPRHRLRAGAAAPVIAELGDDVWRGAKPTTERGVVLGSPIGNPDLSMKQNTCARNGSATAHVCVPAGKLGRPHHASIRVRQLRRRL